MDNDIERVNRLLIEELKEADRPAAAAVAVVIVAAVVTTPTGEGDGEGAVSVGLLGEEKGEDLIDVNLPIPYRLRMAPVIQFAAERRRGWVESEDSPPRDPRDMWDERRHARLQKRQPGGGHFLCVERREWVGGYRVDQAFEMPVGYWLERNGEIELLDHLQWADWDRDGNLLVATRSGKLEIWKLDGDCTEVLFEEDLSLLEPNPVPAPDWARQW